MRLVLIDNTTNKLIVYEKKVVIAVFEIENPKEGLDPVTVETARTMTHQTRA